ncbi:MAG TPA: alanine racemase [Candidatus Acidoferrum sp.]|jgi:diaminopimelate decarboxylase|nr:alanine racemase [Candidatus Acidoferrum sp.]
MSVVREPPGSEEDDRPRRGRPRTRNEIVRVGRLGGVEPEELAARFGTPVYVYDLDVVDRQVEALRAALPGRFELAYAVKANPSLAVVEHLGRLGLGADVASAGELSMVRRAGIEPARIVMTGPGKRDDELTAAVAAGVRVITVESSNELRRLETIAAGAGRRVPVLLRAAVGGESGGGRVRLVGDDGAGKFGMDPDELLVAARAAAGSAHLEPLGIHAFGISNVLDPGTIADHVEATVTQGAALAQAAGFRLRLVDAGGGLGIPYESHEESLDLVGLGTRLRTAAARWEADPALRGTSILLEPGRFLVGPAGAYLCRVVDRKSLGGETVVVLDGGIHHLVRPALTGSEHRIRSFGRTGGADRHWPVTVAGPLCSGLDVFTRHAVLAVPEVGDLMAVLDAGAYGYTESMPLFLSHPSPAEVVTRGGRAALARRRVEPDRWLEDQRVPDWSATDPG